MTLVRPATADDLPLLAAIEDAADARFEERFGATGWPAADSGEDRAAEPGVLLVAGDPVVGFAHVLDLGGSWHLDQVAVLPAHGRSGIGAALLHAVHAEVVARGGTEVTLTTFAEVPWNAPFYARHGYAVLRPPLPEHLRPSLEAQDRLGMSRFGPRVAMRWSGGGSAGPGGREDDLGPG